jgi:ankyrin repeat protein
MPSNTIPKLICNAADQGNIEILRICVTTPKLANSKRNATRGDTWTALTCAASKNHFECVEFLLEQGAHVHTIPSDVMNELIYSAAGDGRLSILRACVTNATLANARNQNNWTALMTAAKSGLIETVQFLLKKGADVNAVTHPNDPDWKSKDEDHGDTAIDLALSNEKFHIVELLLLKGAKFNYICADGDTALLTVAHKIPASLVEPVLSHCSDEILNSLYHSKEEDDNDCDLLWLAAKHDNWPLVSGILKHHPQHLNFKPTTGASEGLPAIHFALMAGELDIAKEMLTQGASLDYIDRPHGRHSQSGLMVAMECNLPKDWTNLVLSRVSDETLKHRGSYRLHDGTDRLGDTALDLAVKHKNWPLISGILSRTPRDLSVRSLKNDEINLLKLALKAERWAVILMLLPRHAQRIKGYKFLNNDNKPTSLKSQFEILFIISQHYQIANLPLAYHPELFWNYFKDSDDAAIESFFKKHIYLNKMDIFNASGHATYHVNKMDGFGRRPRNSGFSDWAEELAHWATHNEKTPAEIPLVKTKMQKWCDVVEKVTLRNRLCNKITLPTSKSDYDEFFTQVEAFINPSTSYDLAGLDWLQMYNNKVEFVTYLAQFCGEGGLEQPALAKGIYELVKLDSEQKKQSKLKFFYHNAALAHQGLTYLAPTKLNGEPQDEDSYRRNLLEHAVSATETSDKEMKKDCEKKAALFCEDLGVNLPPERLALTPANFVNLIFDLAAARNPNRNQMQEEKQVLGLDIQASSSSSSSQMQATSFFSQSKRRGCNVEETETLKRSKKM